MGLDSPGMYGAIFKAWAKRRGLRKVLHHCSRSKFSLILCRQQHKQQEIHLLHMQTMSSQQAVAFDYQTLVRFGTHFRGFKIDALVTWIYRDRHRFWSLFNSCECKIQGGAQLVGFDLSLVYQATTYQNQIPCNIESHPYNKRFNNNMIISFKLQNYVITHIHLPILSNSIPSLCWQKSPHTRLHPPL
jgi:hypothetical protein